MICKMFENQYKFRENLKQLAVEDSSATEAIVSHVMTTKDATLDGSVKISQ